MQTWRVRAGDQIVMQEVWRGRLWTARPATVVVDADDLLALWMPAGTAFKAPSNPGGRERKATPRERMLDNLRFVDWNLRDVEAPHSTLYLLIPGAWFAVWRSWVPDGTRLGWYVNFQEPFRRVGPGIRTMDLALDLVVAPGGERTLKDRAEFDTLGAEGLLSEATMQSVLAALDDAHRRLDGGEPPFEGRWAEFVPDPSWPTPTLRSGWDVVDDDLGAV
jgi:hypothetical protein